MKAIISELYITAHIGDSIMQNSYSQLNSISLTKLMSTAFNKWV